jgi:peptidoglycan/LPS O-acetylase OafA/YrhL
MGPVEFSGIYAPDWSVEKGQQPTAEAAHVEHRDLFSSAKVSRTTTPVELIPHVPAVSSASRTREYIPYLNAFRGVAILLVILTHIVILSHIPSPLWLFCLFENATVFFVFISGVLFSHLFDEKESVWSFWYKKTTRLILPYAVSALPGIIYVLIAKSEGGSVGYVIKTFVTGVHHANDAHWYVPFIVLVFATYPLLQVLQRHRATLLVVTAIWLAVSAFTFRSNFNANPLITLMHFGSVFLGHYMVEHGRGPAETYCGS